MKPLLPLLFAITGVACSSAPAQDSAPFPVELRAFAQDGSPLAGATFAIGRKTLGMTHEDGRSQQRLSGTEGNILNVAATCPVDYDPLETPAPLRLTRTHAIQGREPQPLSVELRCQKKLKDIVVVVHAERGDHLPVLLDGKPVATTDDEGIAHLLLRRAREEKSVQLALDTSSRPTLKPANPARSYELSARDAVVLFEPTFSVGVPIPAPTRGPAVKRHIPVRVD